MPAPGRSHAGGDRPALPADYPWFRQYDGPTETVNLDARADESVMDYAVSVLEPYR